MKKIRKINIFISILLLTAMIAVMISGCALTQDDAHSDDAPPFTSYRDIPGLTDDQLREIEQVLASRDSFSYAMMLSTEAFYDENGNIRGYSKLFSEYLSELFGIPFIPEIVTFERLLEGLEEGSIDFTGTLTPTPERRETYHMTDPIAQRALTHFRMASGEPIAEIIETRAPRYAMLRRAAIVQTVIDFAFYDFELVLVDEYLDAYELLKNNEIDALLAESSNEALFETMGDIVTEPFFPMINAFVSFTAYRDELAPIVNAVQKLLESGGEHYTAVLYDTGYDEYLYHKLSLQLTSEEREYIANNSVIPFGAEYDNYPICFYDEREESWQGIAIDVMDEICALTGLRYSVVNETDTSFSNLINMLESGEIYVISELISSPEREGVFLWPGSPFINDRSVLMSRTGYHNVSLSRVYSESVGLVRNTAHTEFFNTWFPNHPLTEIYDDHFSAMEALRNGDVDLVMTSYSTSLYLSNYMEETIYAPSVIFDNSFESTYGINREQQLLHSVMDKAMRLIDITAITDHWMHKTYDYRLSLAEQNNTLFRGMILVMLCCLLLISAFLIRNHYTNKRLGELVDQRTQELAQSVEEISRARDEAEVANKSKSFFLANMSHEIRTPMNAISGITEIILQNEDIPDDVQEGLSRIEHSCNLLMGIINDILDFSKIEAGKLDINEKEYNTASVINDSAQLNMMRIGSKEINFVLDVDENLPARLLGDELRIKQIMNNLLSNAFKYTDEGEVKLTVLSESNKKVQDKVILVISVEDTGCGMTEEQVGKLFEEYARFNEDGTNKLIEGTGLGLPITKQLATLMGGSIDVESKAGAGSRFTVKLPQGLVDDEVIGKDIKDNLTSFKMYFGKGTKGHNVVREPMPYGTVLVVDDVEPNLYVAIGLMKPYKLNIETAMSGSEAINLIESGKTYDVVFMDHMMPDMDGVETTERLRAMGYTEPIVALTANAVAGQSDMFLNSGFDDFVSKPIDIRQLNSVLNKYVRDKQAPDVIDRARKEHESVNNGGHMNAGGNGENASKPIRGSDDKQQINIKNKTVEGINIASGIEKYNNDEEIFIKILSVYTANTQKQIEDIDRILPVSENNIDDYRLKVHSIKGTSLDIYATQIGNTAAELESAAKDGEYEYINENTPAFLVEVRKILQRLDELLKEIQDENPKPVRDKPDVELLMQLRDACGMYSMDSVNRAMDEIEKYRYENDDDLAQWLRGQVNIMGFAQIVEKIDELYGKAD